jgi:hypothetical protein
MEVFNPYISKDILDNVIIPYLNLEDIIKTNDFYSFTKRKNYAEIYIWEVLVNFERIKMLKYLFEINFEYDRKIFSWKVSQNPSLKLLNFTAENDIKFDGEDMRQLVKSATLEGLEFLFNYKINEKYPYRDDLIDELFCSNKFEILSHFNNIDKSCVLSEKFIYDNFNRFKSRRYISIEKLEWIYENNPKEKIRHIMRCLANYKDISLILHIINKYKDKISSDEILFCIRELFCMMKHSGVINYIVSVFINELLSTDYLSINYQLYDFVKDCFHGIIESNNIINQADKIRLLKIVNKCNRNLLS